MNSSACSIFRFFDGPCMPVGAAYEFISGEQKNRQHQQEHIIEWRAVPWEQKITIRDIFVLNRDFIVVNHGS